VCGLGAFASQFLDINTPFSGIDWN